MCAYVCIIQYIYVYSVANLCAVAIVASSYVTIHGVVPNPYIYV